MALSFCCGAECEVMAVGAATPTGNARHWSTWDAAVTNVATTVRTGSRAFQHAPSAATGRLYHPLPASQTDMALRAYLRFSSLPTANAELFEGLTAAANRLGVGYRQSDSKLTATSNGGLQAGGVTITTDVWYLVETIVSCVADPHTIDVYVDGMFVNSRTYTAAASTFSHFAVGNVASNTMTMFSDDIAASWGISSQSRIGHGRIYGLTPNADGTHSFDDGDFIYNAAGGNIATTATDVWQYCSEPLDTTVGNFVNHAASEVSSPDYVEVTLPNLPVSPTAVNGVEIVAAYHSAGTSANNVGMKMNDGTNTADIHGLIDVSESTILTPSWHQSTAPDGGAWTETDVNNLRIRWGYSTDANPDAYLDGVRAEVDVTITSMPDRQPARRYAHLIGR